MNGSNKDKHTSGATSPAGQTARGTVDLNELSSILELLSANDVTEFEFKRGDMHIALRRGPEYPQPQPQAASSPQIIPFPYPNYQTPAYAPPQSVPAGGPSTSPQVVVSPAPSTDATVTTTTSSTKTVVELTPSKQLKEITSPIVGTFYRRPAVDAEPYVDVGDTVKKGDVLCIVEAMKLMNEIEADAGGKIVEICVQDASMVEYGEVLFRIEPL